MTPEEFQEVAVVFEEARQRKPGDRTRFLQARCGDRPRIRAEVESLLSHHDDEADPLSGEAGRAALRQAAVGVLEERSGSPPDDATDLAPVHATPKRIDQYTIVRELGEGGMGVVYEARQDSPRRTVALKMIRPGAGSRKLVRRFEQETNVLGELQHPGIAQIFEAGTADTGHGPQPFFAMEFIDGTPLTRFAERAALSARDRLALFARVCDAVQYAHEKGVIHRDLKPPNILVDAAGNPKILDFGVARVTDSDVQATTLRTDAGQLIGTVPYMSPEQVSGDPAAIDARSDVYALGVLLYELLAERLPYEVAGRSIPDAARLICDSEPGRLSTISRAFRGDVETIVAKALEKDKARRYQSAAELAADVRRYLADEPIVARPASTFYQFRKFAKRNKALVGGAVGVFLALVVGVIGTTIGMVRARTASVLAKERLVESQQQAGIAKAVNDFLNDDLLSTADPENSPDRDLTVRAALDTAAEKVEERFADEPLVEAAIRVTLGRTYRNLGLFDEAEKHLLRAIELRRKYLGPDDPDTLAAENHIGILYNNRGRFDAAEKLFRTILEKRRRLIGNEDYDTLSTINNLGLLLMDSGRFEEAESLLVEAYETRERTLPSEHPDVLLAVNNLASLYWEQGRYRKALPLYEKTLAARMRVHGPDHRRTLTSMNNLATCLIFCNRAAEAAVMALETVERSRRVLGPDHPETISAVNTLAGAYMQQRKFAEAAPILADVVAAMKRTRVAGHWTTGVCESNQGLNLIKLKRYDEAEPVLREAYDILSVGLGPRHDRTITVVDHLIMLYEARGDAERVAAWRAKRSEPAVTSGSSAETSGG